MRLSSQSNNSIKSENLQALSKMRNDQGPVFSLYLSLRPDKQAASDPLSRFEMLLRQSEQQRKLDQNPSSYQVQWAAEVEYIRNWLTELRPSLARSLALFTSQAAGIWNTFLLPVPISDRLVISDRPYVRPLEILHNEFTCTLVALIDSGAARLVKVFLGEAEETETTQAVPVTGGAFEDGLREHARATAERTEAAWREMPCANLIIGGPDQAHGYLRKALPGTLLKHITGEVRLTPHATLEEILAQVQKIADEDEKRIEEQRVNQIVTSANMDNKETAVLGMEQTLLAVRAKKIRLLVAEEDFHREGGECPNCGYLGEWEQGVCLLCEMALRPEPDIIEAAFKRVLEHGGEIDVVRSLAARQELASHGRIGALLHDSGTKPTEKNPSNQATINGHSEIHPDAAHDEAVDESFPASDPPGW